MRNREAARLCVTNAEGGTGKTTIAINVAGALNERGRDVLVPALTESSSERTIELLVDQVAALERQVDISVDTVGVVANRVENTGEDRTMVEWLSAVFGGYPVREVRKRVALQRAFSAGQSVFAYDEAVDMAEVFLEIATELDRQFGYAEVTA
jgi:chromosome partitioning protein